MQLSNRSSNGLDRTKAREAPVHLSEWSTRRVVCAVRISVIEEHGKNATISASRCAVRHQEIHTRHCRHQEQLVSYQRVHRVPRDPAKSPTTKLGSGPVTGHVPAKAHLPNESTVSESAELVQEPSGGAHPVSWVPATPGFPGRSTSAFTEIKRKEG